VPARGRGEQLVEESGKDDAHDNHNAARAENLR
jgi:hypothetical protein